MGIEPGAAGAGGTPVRTENTSAVYRRLALGTLVFVAGVIAASLFIIGPNAQFIAGAGAGGLLMGYKAVFWWRLPSVIPPSGVKERNGGGKAKHPVGVFFLNVGIQLMTGAALLTAVLVSEYLLAGMASGMLASIAGTVAGTVCSRAWRA